MASNTPRYRDRSRARGHRLVRRTVARSPFWLAIIAIALLASTITPYAQSGRNKKQSPSPDLSPAPRPTPRPTPLPGPPPAPSPSPRSPGPNASTGSETPPPFEEVDPHDVVRVDANLVTIPAFVVDTQGQAVSNLKLEDFELRVEGQPRALSELSRSETPVRMVLLFDNSMSMREGREFEKQAAIRFLRRVLRPIDQAAIYSIYTYPILTQPFTSDVQLLVRTIERFLPPDDGATALFDTIAKAADYLRSYEGRKVIVIVSDGADTISDLDFDTTLHRALLADCQIYAVQTGQNENANLYNLAAYRRLQEFSSQTGGSVFIPKQTTDLDTAFAQIAADLSQQYLLSYYPTDDKRDGRFRTISLRIPARPNLRVRARKGYYPPKG